MTARTHELKCWPSYFQAVMDGRKTFEVRENDRDFAEGDLVVLREFDPSLKTWTTTTGATTGAYTEREYTFRIGYVLIGFFDDNTCAFSLLPVTP